MTFGMKVLAASAMAAALIGGGVAVAAPESSPSTPAPAAAPPAAQPDFTALAEQALQGIGPRLKLTEDQTARIRPLLTTHLAGMRQIFIDYSDPSGSQFPALMQEFQSRRERFRTSLQPILTPPQMKEMDVIRKEVDVQIRDTICNERLAILKPRLSLTGDQETRLRPILLEDFERKRDLVAVMTVPTGGPAVRKAPTAQAQDIQAETETKLRGVLNPQQMSAYEAYRDELRDQARKNQ